jgi:acetyltransferase-like isoleucine patch superfamily enzyme
MPRALWLRRTLRYVRAQRPAIHPRLWLAQMISRCLPAFLLPRLRTAIYRWAGFHNVDPRAELFGTLAIYGSGDLYPRLHVGEGAGISHSCSFDLNMSICIGKRVAMGHDVCITTGSHRLGPPRKRAGELTFEPVTIGDGAWIGARATILPGVTIGPGAMVAAGSVVAKDVPANAQVAGNPSRVIGWLDQPSP